MLPREPPYHTHTYTHNTHTLMHTIHPNTPHKAVDVMRASGTLAGALAHTGNGVAR